MIAPPLPEEWSLLLNGMADETLTAEQEERLTQLLRTDPAFRREYVRSCQLQTLLTWQAAGSEAEITSRLNVGISRPSPQPAKSHSRARQPRIIRRRIAVCLSSAAVAIILGFAWLFLSHSSPEPLGRITQISGRLELKRGDQPIVSISESDREEITWHLQPGDRLETDRQSSAELTLPGGSAIRLQPKSQLVLEAASRLRLPAGSLHARVQPRAVAHELKFLTPSSEIHVLGTELEVLAASERSEVAVTEGRIRATRTSDGRAAEVAAGEFLAVSPTGDLVVTTWPLAPLMWSVDFEQGLPPGWSGRPVHEGLPEGSRGAIQTVPADASRSSLVIASPHVEKGLFRWRADAVLHITFQVQPPGWFHVLIETRAYGDPQATSTYAYINPELWQSRPGEWRTVSIPLAEFHRRDAGTAAPTLGRIPTRIVFRAPRDAAGLLIDRIWVD